MTFLQDAEQYRIQIRTEEDKNIQHLKEGLDHVHGDPAVHYNSEVLAGDQGFFDRTMAELNATLGDPIWQKGRRSGVKVQYLGTSIPNLVVGVRLKKDRLEARVIYVISNDGIEALKGKPKQN